MELICQAITTNGIDLLTITEFEIPQKEVIERLTQI